MELRGTLIEREIRHKDLENKTVLDFLPISHRAVKDNAAMNEFKILIQPSQPSSSREEGIFRQVSPDKEVVTMQELEAGHTTLVRC